MSIWKEAVDIQTADMLHLPTPEAEYITVTTEPSKFQQDMVAELGKRAGAVRNRQVEPNEDNMRERCVTAIKHEKNVTKGVANNFCLPASDADCPRLAVAESPIDALSLATLVKRSGGDWKDCSYLSLGGTAPRAMLQFLHDHPQVTQVSLCLDNDKAGLTRMERLEQAIREDPKLSQRMALIYRNPPPKEHGKDYNEFLCAGIKAVQQQRQRKQHDGVR